jgi:uncharacterized protein YwlG (UPF0340 family)
VVVTVGRMPRRLQKPVDGAGDEVEKHGGASELAEVKREIRNVLGDVLDGKVERGVGVVAFQGYNCLLKAIEVERKVKEQEELEARLEPLEQSQGSQGRGS